MIERVISYESSGSYLCVKTIHDPNPKKHLHDLSFVKLSFTDTCLDFLSIFDISPCKISSNPLELSKMLLKLMNPYKFTFYVYLCRYLTSWQLIFGRGLIFRIFNRLNLRFPFFWLLFETFLNFLIFYLKKWDCDIVVYLPWYFLIDSDNLL